MKLIILAAGRGSRLSKYTRDCPKGMLEFAGRSLLKHQIDTFREYGISDINIVRGYKKDKIIFDDVKYFDNSDFSNTNMVESLMCAEKTLNDNCVVTYSDLILEKGVVSQVVNSEYDIGVVVDKNFEEYWKLRLGDEYLEDMESLVISGDQKITSLGKLNPAIEEVHGRYVGAIKFSRKGIESLIRCYQKHKLRKSLNSMGNRPFEKWHMTDLLQAIIGDGNIVNPIIISRGWLEFDTDKDYDTYKRWFQENSIHRFINL